MIFLNLAVIIIFKIYMVIVFVVSSCVLGVYIPKKKKKWWQIIERIAHLYMYIYVALFFLFSPSHNQMPESHFLCFILSPTPHTPLFFPFTRACYPPPPPRDAFPHIARDFFFRFLTLLYSSLSRSFKLDAPAANKSLFRRIISTKKKKKFFPF